MKGVQAWYYGAFHPQCRATGHVDVVEFAGFKYLRCANCGVLANLEAISPKYDDYEACMKEVRNGGSSPSNSEQGPTS